VTRRKSWRENKAIKLATAKIYCLIVSNFTTLAKQPCAEAEVDGVKGELDLRALLGGVDEEQVIVPVHKNAGSKVMEATGTSRPKFFGSTQGT